MPGALYHDMHMEIYYKFLFTIIACTVLLHDKAEAQFGASISYDSQYAPNWETLIDDSDSLFVPGTFMTFGVNYWLRPKNLRIEILPEIAYRRNIGNTGNSGLVARTHSFDLNINALVYVFDLGNDCNCPTFSKQGNFFRKGFYLEASAGGSLGQFDIRRTVGGEGRKLSQSNRLLGKAGVGAGLDFGISDLVTISPWAKYEWHFGGRWDQLSEFSNGDSSLETSPLSYLRFGLRLMFRPDYRPFR